jgi:acyl-CoA thioesterase FadM
MSSHFEMTYVIPTEMLESQYQHLHHADVMRVLEKARVQFLAELGLPQEELLRQDCFLVLQGCEVRFLREIKSETLRCTVEVVSLEGTSGFRLKQEILKAPKRLAVQAFFELTAMSGVRRRRRELPEELQRLLLQNRPFSPSS